MRCGAALRKDLVSEYAQFLSCSPGIFPAANIEPKMAAAFHKNPLPAWIALPVMSACAVAVLATWGTGSLLLGLAAGLIAALAAACWAERTLRSVVGTIAQIAGGDGYAALPDRIHGGALADSVAAAEAVRQALIDADALGVDQRSRE